MRVSALGEDRLIRRVARRIRTDGSVVRGIGDDCAVLAPRPGMQLAVSTDMLVEGRHFLPNVYPRTLGHKALAVNLSDLAACGAQPLAFSLALALPQADEAWLAAFSQGLLALADAHDCELIGGDTTQGPLNICITVFGEVPQGQALLRSGARAGDDLYVSGTLGDAALALATMQGRISLPAAALTAARQRLEQPTPRVALGLALRGVATAAIDVSDGLLGDLGHVLTASGVGATVTIDETINLVATNAYYTRDTGQFFSTIETPQWLQWALAGGDDYELLFTAPLAQRAAVQAAARRSHTAITRLGQIDTAPGLRLVDGQGQAVVNTYKSFDHFA